MSARWQSLLCGDHHSLMRVINLSVVRFSLASAIGVAANLIFALSVALASPLSTGVQCQYPTNSTLYTGYNGSEYWYAQIYTVDQFNNTCYNCAEGAKGNLTHDGLPYT